MWDEEKLIKDLVHALQETHTGNEYEYDRALEIGQLYLLDHGYKQSETGEWYKE